MTDPWVCVTCGQAITGNDGIIELINSNPDLGEVGALPVIASDDDDYVAGPNIAIIAYHHPECDPHPENEGYWFQAERAATLEAWTGWVLHLSEKTWLSRGDLMRVLAYWSVNRGRGVPQM